MASGTATLTGYLVGGYYLITTNGVYTKNIPISGSAPSGVVYKKATIKLQLRNAGWNTITFKANNTTNIGTMGAGGTPSGTTPAERTASLSKTYNYANLQTLTLSADQTDRTELVGNASNTIIITLDWEDAATACGAPTLSVYTTPCGTDTVAMSWSGATSGSNNAITGYEIQYRDSTNGTSYTADWAALTTVSTTATSGSANLQMPSTPSMYRQFRIRTVGAAGAGYESDWYILGLVQRFGVCKAPTSITISDSTPPLETQITVSWTGASAGVGDTISGYALWRSDDVNGPYEQIDMVYSTDTYDSMYTTSSDVFGEIYYYKVQTLSATDSMYNSPLSTVYTSAASGYGLPTAPTSVTATPISTYPGAIVKLEWSGATDGYMNPITGYTISRSTTADGTYAEVLNVTGASVTSTQVKAPDDAGTTYYYKVSSVGTVNGYNSANSTATAEITAAEQPVVNGGIGRTNAVVD